MYHLAGRPPGIMGIMLSIHKLHISVSDRVRLAHRAASSASSGDEVSTLLLIEVAAVDGHALALPQRRPLRGHAGAPRPPTVTGKQGFTS